MNWKTLLGPIALVAVVGVLAIAIMRSKPKTPPGGNVANPARTAAAEPDDALRVGRHVFQPGKEDNEGTLDIFTDGKPVQHITGTNFILKDFVEALPGWKNGTDINGDGIPEVVVMEDSGGAHCCTSWRIFHAGDTVEQIYEVSNGHTDFFPFVDARHDGNLALQVYDWTF